MKETKDIDYLLNQVVKDNQTFKFPVEYISKELINMYMSQEEIEYFTGQAYRRIKNEFGLTYAHIFLTTFNLKLRPDEVDLTRLPIERYQEEINDFITTLESLYITRIEKKSPDGSNG